jgi:DNA-directed RNA polymerase subunit RPC12/RpoP
MNLHCADCDQTFLLTPDGATQSVACPHCGGQRLERDQPSPTHSDGDLRNMVDPSTGLDQGGNPNQEGIWGSTDGGWQTWKKRDESFASVKTAAITVTPPAPGGFHNGPISLLARLKSVKVNGQYVSPETMGDLYAQYGMGERSPGWLQPLTIEAHHPAFEQLAAQIVQDGHGYPDAYKDQVMDLQQRVKAGEIPIPAAPNPEGVYSSLYRISFDDAGFDFDFGKGSPTHKFIVDQAGRTVSLPEPTTHEAVADAHGLHRQGFPQGMSLGELYDNGETGWFQHQSGHSNDALASMLYGHFGHPVTIDPELRPSTNEERFGISPGYTPGDEPYSELKRLYGPASPRSYGTPRDNEGLVRGGSLSMEPYLPWTHEVEPTPRTGAFLAPLAEGLGAIGVGGAIGGLMRGALIGTGSHAVQGLLGEGGASEGASIPPPPRDPSLLASTHEADLETPHGNPGYYHDDPEAIDQHEFNDGESDPNQNNPNLDDSGASGEDNVNAQFSPGALERVNVLAPLLLHYYHSDQSGASDPLIRALHEQLEQENPGYLDHADDEKLQGLLDQVRQPDSVHARVSGPIGMPVMTGPMNVPQQAVPGAIPQTTQQGTCPYCGGTTTADGTCPQCGAKSNPMGGALPGQPQGGAPMPYTGKTAADHQGPVTDEQKSAVAELLLSEGRGDEIPVMLRQPWDYAREMAQVAQRINQPPNVDPNEPPPPQPAQEVAPPGATMPVPNPADPTQQMAAAVHRLATPHNAAPRCPKCNSSTTGFMHNGVGDVRGQCHSCGNIWNIDEAEVARTAAGENPDRIPAADHQERNDNAGDVDSSHTWQDDGGQPLQEGQEYEMRSPGYQIPDKVRVVQVKPNAIVVETIGEYSNDESQPLTYQHEITKEEADLEGLSFTPGSGDSDAGEQSLDQYADSSQAPVNTEAQPAPSTSYPSTASSVESGLSGDMCPRCAGTHISSELSSPTTNYHECFKCGHSWETKEEDYIDENTASREWIKQDSSPGGDDFFSEMERHKAMRESGIGTRNIADIASRDTRLQRIREKLNEEAQTRTAGRKFTPREQRELIEEDGVARNADKLNLGGTHYEAHRYVDRGHGMPANGENAPDEHMFLGL